MLSGLLNSEIAIEINITIMRAFVMMRQWVHYVNRRLRYACHGNLLSLLGHASSRTTEIYTHVSTKNLQQIRSPFDDL
jgi:integrase